MAKSSMVERSVTLAGNPYRLVFNFGAVAALEECYGKPADQIARGWTVPVLDDAGAPVLDDRGNPTRKTNITVRDVQRMIYAGTRKYHPDVTLDGVLDLLDETVASGRSFELVLKETFDAFEQGQPDARPPAAAAG